MPSITSPVLALPAENSLTFLDHVFACWAEGRVFAIMRDPQALEGRGLTVQPVTLPEGPARLGWARM
ncbi:hypothetical protein D3P06_19370, partial [Paracoccus aestuarii]